MPAIRFRASTRSAATSLLGSMKTAPHALFSRGSVESQRPPSQEDGQFLNDTSEFQAGGETDPGHPQGRRPGQARERRFRQAGGVGELRPPAPRRHDFDMPWLLFRTLLPQLGGLVLMLARR